MNARQKAKKYKQELDRLKNMTIKPKIIYTEYPVREFKAIRRFPMWEADVLTEDRILHTLSRDILENKDIWNCMNLRWGKEEHTNSLVIEANIGVVDYGCKR